MPDPELREEFSNFLLTCGAVKFGSFRLKSGRVSPYFINLGCICDGPAIARLGEFYARAVVDQGLLNAAEVLFGPAYKGIPIAVSAAIALSNLFGCSRRYAFNRKEAKDHGEGGLIVGDVRDGDRVGMLDDVMTTGRTKEEVLAVIRASAKVEISYVMIAVDRLERGESDLMATAEFEKQYGIPVRSIVTVEDVASAALKKGMISVKAMEEVERYLKAYGGRREI